MINTISSAGKQWIIVIISANRHYLHHRSPNHYRPLVPFSYSTSLIQNQAYSSFVHVTVIIIICSSSRALSITLVSSSLSSPSSSSSSTTTLIIRIELEVSLHIANSAANNDDVFWQKLIILMVFAGSEGHHVFRPFSTSLFPSSLHPSPTVIIMTGCFDFRLRASPSVDLDRIQANHDASRFPMSFSKLFRSRSDGSVKTARSQSEGPTARTSSRDHRSPSPVASASAGNRRRYVRVVRSDDTRDARHASGDSAHVVVRSRSYSSTDRNRLKKSASADAGVAGGSRGAQLQRTSSPYTSSGHTILKKYNHSLDAGTGTVDNASAAGVPEVSPPNSKHASFR